MAEGIHPERIRLGATTLINLLFAQSVIRYACGMSRGTTTLETRLWKLFAAIVFATFVIWWFSAIREQVREDERRREYHLGYCAVILHHLPDWVLVGLNGGEMNRQMHAAIIRAQELAQQRFPSSESYRNCPDFYRRTPEETRLRQFQLFLDYDAESLRVRR
jgi:hypothetical protein